MNTIWKRSFEFAFPVERVWQAYFEYQGSPDGTAPPVGFSFEMTDRARSKVEILDVKEHELLSWSTAQGEDVSEITIAFESITTGTRITITRAGFGEGEEFEIFRTSNLLGFTESMKDLAAYLITGINRSRHLEDKSSTGVAFKELDGALEVVRVHEGSLGEQAGLQRGDVVLWIDGAAIYGRSDLWLIQRIYEPGREVEIAYTRDGKVLMGRGRMQPIDSSVVGELGAGPRERRAS